MIDRSWIYIYIYIHIHIYIYERKHKCGVDSKKFQHGCRLMRVGVPFFFALGLEDGPVSTFWLQL